MGRANLYKFSAVWAFVSLLALVYGCGKSEPPERAQEGRGLSTNDVVTYHFDNARTGVYANETTLNPTNVNFKSFGKIGFYSVDGKVDGQPLYLFQMSISAGVHNVLYVVTEHDSVYAFDADSGAILWKKSMLGSGETTSDPVDSCFLIAPEIGITSTPVIDRARGVMYVVAMSKRGGTYIQRLHALDVTTGLEMFGGPTTIQASYPGTGDNSSNGRVVFDPKQYTERAGLLLLNGIVYTTWTSHCDVRPYTGWVIGYDASTLMQVKVLNITPNGSDGAIWMAGTAPAADTNGNIFLLSANGTFETTLDAGGFPDKADFGNCFLKIATSGGLSVADYFTMSNTVEESDADLDLGSGGAIVLPDLTDENGQTRHLAVGAGKDRTIYVVDRDNMGRFNATDNIYQEISGALDKGVFSMPAYFKNTIYYGAGGDRLKAFAISNAKLSTTATSQSVDLFSYPGTTPSVSANGTTNGIVWTMANDGIAAVLRAYDATDLGKEIYNTEQAASSRDRFGPGNKFITPVITNGKVFVGTTNGVAVFGLLP